MIERRDVPCRLTGDTYVEAFHVPGRGRIISSIVQVPYLDMQDPKKLVYNRAVREATEAVQRWLDANQRR